VDLGLAGDLAPKLRGLKSMSTSDEKAEGLQSFANDWKGTDSAN